MPAHFCGVFGMKPTYGRVPYYPVAAGDYSAHLGPITRNVADAALMLQVMAVPHPLDHTSCESAASTTIPRQLGRWDQGQENRVQPGSRVLPASIRKSPRWCANRGHGRDLEALGAHVEQVTPAYGRRTDPQR